jgi:type IV secretion system protein VirB4
MADLLPYATAEDSGVVMCKDGSVLAGYFFRGEDLQSCTDERRNQIALRVNNALARFGSGFVFWIDAVRLDTPAYWAREANHFPDPVSRMLDEERRQHFSAKGRHFETHNVLIVQYRPPALRNQRVEAMLYSNDNGPKITPKMRAMEVFNRALKEIEDGLGDVMKLRRMVGYQESDGHGGVIHRDELVTYLHFCATGLAHPINLPSCAMYMDAYIGGQEMYSGNFPKIGECFNCIVAIEGFPAESYPGILDIMDHMAISYRWSTRFILLDQHEALGVLGGYERAWKQKTVGMVSALLRRQNGAVNHDAINMVRGVQSAITDCQSGLVAYGYYTSNIILTGDDVEILKEDARRIAREIRKIGFPTRVETNNAVDALVGSWPGVTVANVRRPLLHTLTVADLLPLSTAWPGLEYNPCNLYPPNSPPLLQGATSGSTPFRVNLHQDDLGHTLIIGPTGSGKSVLLSSIAAGFRRYPRATITVFDKGRSMFVTCKAMGGAHNELGPGMGVGLCPLSRLNDGQDIAWAAEWIESLYRLQAGADPSPHQKQEILRGLQQMAQRPNMRSLSNYVFTLQNEDLRSALGYYTMSGPLGTLLDAEKDSIADLNFTVHEMEDLMNMGDKILVPVLLVLFRRFELSLKGQPALLILDEAWVMMGHPVFREKLREWLKVLRKANCAVVLATQSLGDATRSGIFNDIKDSCPTKILLANGEAEKAGTKNEPGPRELYTSLGCNERQLNIVASLRAKRHYYYMTAENARVFSLDLSRLQLAIVAASDKDSVAHARALIAQYGEGEWVHAWLQQKNIEYRTFIYDVSEPLEISYAA